MEHSFLFFSVYEIQSETHVRAIQK